jgi:meso-butanediol dehydrogenase/(S,S)-butanediol dehydrogenase/diacetyl reductase
VVYSIEYQFDGGFFLSRAAIARMKKQCGGGIVNTSSAWGVYPGPGHLAYCTSKDAVAAMAKSLGRDHAGLGSVDQKSMVG